MRGMRTAALALGTLLAVSPAALAQQNQGQGSGWGGALDQLNRAVNPNSYSDEQRERERTGDRERAVRDERRNEGSSNSDRRDRGGYSRYSDRDLQDQYDRLIDEQRQMQRERRAIEDEMSRRNIRR